jgi:hypothetical protein
VSARRVYVKVTKQKGRRDSRHAAFFLRVHMKFVRVPYVVRNSLLKAVIVVPREHSASGPASVIVRSRISQHSFQFR